MWCQPRKCYNMKYAESKTICILTFHFTSLNLWTNFIHVCLALATLSLLSDIKKMEEQMKIDFKCFRIRIGCWRSCNFYLYSGSVMYDRISGLKLGDCHIRTILLFCQPHFRNALCYFCCLFIPINLGTLAVVPDFNVI